MPFLLQTASSPSIFRREIIFRRAKFRAGKILGRERFASGRAGERKKSLPP